MPERRFYWFAYMLNEVAHFLGRTDSFEEVIHMTRDGTALAEIQALLSEGLGWSYAGVILNLPASALEGRGFAPAPSFTGEDAFALVGRAPLDDAKGYKRIVFRSDSPVERMVFGRLRKVIYKSRRPCILLQPELSPHNPMRAVMYRITNHGRVGSIYRHGPFHTVPDLEGCAEQDREDTLGYLVWVPGDREAGIPGILNIFGMGGAETLFWTAYLRRRAVELIRELVAEDEMRVMAARFARPVMDTIPIDPSVVDTWGEIEWVLDSKQDGVECAA